VQFRADIFNLFNHPNFENPNGGICNSVQGVTATTPAECTLVNGVPSINPNFGVTGQTVADADSTQIGGGTNRQTQFSLKIIF
jgi:hypothetical protein